MAAFAYHCYFRARNLEGVGGSSIRVPDRVHEPGVPQSRFDDVYRAPSHRAPGSISLGYDDGYRFLGWFLRHLQGPGEAPRRWILKSPEHVFSIDALTGVFPDAMLVLAHRDPGHVLVSAARLTELLRAPFTTTIDRREIGRKVAGYGRRGCGAWSSLPMIRPFHSGSGTSIIVRSSPSRLERSLGSMMRLALSSRVPRVRQCRRRSRGRRMAATAPTATVRKNSGSIRSARALRRRELEQCGSAGTNGAARSCRMIEVALGVIGGGNGSHHADDSSARPTDPRSRARRHPSSHSAGRASA